MSTPADAEQATLITSVVRMTFTIHSRCHVYELCLSVFLINVTFAESSARTVPYAVVDRCVSLAMGYSVSCVAPTGQVSRPPHSFDPNVVPSFTFVALMRYGCVVAMTVWCT